MSEPRRSRWSWRVGAVRGIELRVHATFLVLLAWLAIGSWSEGALAVVVRLLFLLALFGCVLLHELGHALMAQRYGVRTRDITLLPIGGLARLERMPTDGRQELWIALAGPLVNVVIAALLFGALALVPEGRGSSITAVVGDLAFTNVALAVFNLLPAFPMDGGRVLRAVLSVRYGRLVATRRAVLVGRIFASLFAVVGLWLNPMLVLIAAFVWFAASGELMGVELEEAATHQLVADAMVLRFVSVRAGEPLLRALDELLAGTQEDFPVVEHGRVLGMLYKPDLMAGLAAHGEGSPVAAIMRKDVPLLEAAMPLREALERIDEAEGRTLPVARRGRLVGLLTRQNLSELFAAREAVGHDLHRASVG